MATDATMAANPSISWLELKLWFEIPPRGLPFTRTRRRYNEQMRCLRHIEKLEEELLGIKLKHWPSWFATWATSWDGCGWALSAAQRADERREKQRRKLEKHGR